MFTKDIDEQIYCIFENNCNDFCASLPSDEQLSYVRFTKKFKRKMQRLIFNEQQFYYPIINTAFKRVASIAVATILALSTLTLSVEGLREKAFEFLIKVFPQYTSVFTKEYESTITADEFVEHIPSYIPDGFRLVKKENLQGICVTAEYKNQNGKTINFMQDIISGNSIGIDTEQNPYEYIQINGYQAVYYYSEENCGIVFHTKDYVFTVSGSVSKQQIIKIAESIL